MRDEYLVFYVYFKGWNYTISNWGRKSHTDFLLPFGETKTEVMHNAIDILEKRYGRGSYYITDIYIKV